VARLLASLNHPNVAAIYGMEESDGVHALVMELVPGETPECRKIKNRPEQPQCHSMTDYVNH
jgi:serine/threonine protein kinase